MLMFQGFGFVLKFSDRLFRCSRPFRRAISDVAEFSDNNFRCSQGYPAMIFDVVKGSEKTFSMYPRVLDNDFRCSKRQPLHWKQLTKFFLTNQQIIPGAPVVFFECIGKVSEIPKIFNAAAGAGCIENCNRLLPGVKFFGNPQKILHHTPGVKSFQCSPPGILH